MSQNGKSSKRRREDFSKIQNNWDEINWSKKQIFRCKKCENIINKEEEICENCINNNTLKELW